MIRGDTTSKKIALVFTGDQYADGGEIIRSTLRKAGVRASFFLTGNFYANRDFQDLIRGLRKDGHYLGAHSDRHLLYCDWQKRDSLLVTKQQFKQDLQHNYDKMQQFGVNKKDARYFMPPFEWYNDSIASWTRETGLQLINYSPGTRSNADYTTPQMKAYRSSEEIYESITGKGLITGKGVTTLKEAAGLNGFILLLHIGTDPARTDKMYLLLPRLLAFFDANGYEPVRIDELLEAKTEK
ncbi:MAG: polysaccharide deacetylase family protein [Chitinophagaceae bacterium]|nr:MAG: polysaccharide deacetylase family protein [Chitinophagaceae bacterium]